MDEQQIETATKSFFSKMVDKTDPSVCMHDVVYLFMSVLVGGLLAAWMGYNLYHQKDMATWASTVVWIFVTAAGAKSIGDGSVKLPFIGGPK